MNPNIYVKKIDGVRHVFDEAGNEVFDYYRPNDPTPAPPKDFPPLTEQAKGFIKSMTEWAKSGFALSPEKEERWKLCQACEDLRHDRCLHCGCNMRGKIYLGTAYCKLGKW